MASPNPLPQLFGVIPTSQPPITTPTSAPSQTSFIYTLPPRPYSHIVVFLLPGVILPPNTAAGIYLQTPPSRIQAGAPPFKFLGAVGEGKESAVFRVKGLFGADAGGGNTEGEVDMDAPENPELTVGISIEPAESIAAQLASLQSTSPQNQASSSTALVLAAKPTQKPDTLILAQRIIKNAFNFLASFSGREQGGVEVVPLKAFEEWWRKFEGRVRNDPGFLEGAEGD